MASALVLCRFLHFTVVLMLFGAWVYKPRLLGRDTTLDRTLTRISRWLAALALVSGVCWLLLITASMAGAWDAALEPSTLRLVLGQHLLWPGLELASAVQRTAVGLAADAAAHPPALAPRSRRIAAGNPGTGRPRRHARWRRRPVADAQSIGAPGLRRHLARRPDAAW